MIMLEIGFLMRGEVIWDKSASAGISLVGARSSQRLIRV